MAKKFNIHDWQTKQRKILLNEVNIKRVVDQSMSNDDIGKLQDVVQGNNLGKVLNTLAVIVDQDGSQPELAAQKIADLVPDIIDADAAIQKYHYGKDDEGNDRPPTDKFTEPMGETSMTGTGATFKAGAGMGHFGDVTKKKLKK